VERGTAPLSFTQIRPLGGALAHVDKEATAFAHRDRKYMVALINDWDGPDAADRSVHEAWLQEFWQAVRPYGTGVYVNFLEAEERDRIREAYPGATYERLAAIKRKYDPTNFFNLNQNIAPN
jgi:hypothetical protein